MRAGFLNILGNKGAISIVANLMGQSLQFINCHLEAHQNSNDKRNEVLIKITETLVEQDYRSEVFICGDLNYRIEMSKEEYGTYSQKQPNTDEQVKYSGMFDKDQLNNQALLQQHFLPFFEEQGVSFPPTYKMQPHGPEYHRGRIPGWTDRIFHRKGRAKEKGYKCMYNLYGTDHRPVIATFEVSLEETLSAFQEEVGVEGGRARHTCALI
jgi:endonuclease/exonuclease/phosphatase family metal-dependent hydrolase